MLMTTVGSRDDASNIARSLLDQRLAACVQLVPIESFYTWKGSTANEAEILLLIKTRVGLFDRAISAIRKIHPYETPEIVGSPFTAGLADYFRWIDSATK
jgi:periplasmic divalent cation tolerance protein